MSFVFINNNKLCVHSFFFSENETNEKHKNYELGNFMKVKILVLKIFKIVFY